MRFNFSTFNHCRQGKIILEDVTRIMGEQLVALGHGVSWDDEKFYVDAVNFVVESFADDPQTIREIAKASGLGCKIVCIATEEPTLRGFNLGLDPAMIDRQNAFPEAARHFAGILTLIPGEQVRSWYAQHAPTAYVELGYSCPTASDEYDYEPPCHFGFYGRLTRRRQLVISTLEVRSEKSVILVHSLDMPMRERNAIMRNARVILQIKANEHDRLVSNSRCASALLLGRPVVAEPHEYDAPWRDIIHFSRTEESFYDDAMAAAADWRSLHRAQVGRFKLRLPPEVCIGAPLREIGIIP